MTSRAAAHRCLGEAFGFPDWYGAGWDAFNDCIGQFVVDHDGARVAVIWRHLDVAAQAAPATVAEVGWGLLETQIGDMPAQNPANRTRVDLVVFAVVMVLTLTCPTLVEQCRCRGEDCCHG